MSFIFGDGTKQNSAEQQKAIDANTAVSNAEFAKRLAQQKATTGDINTLRQQGFDASTGLQNKDFQAGLDSSDAAFQKKQAIKDAAVGKTIAANADNTTANRTAFTDLGTVTDAERARQAKMQDEATGVLTGLTPQLAVPAFNARQQSDAAAGTGLVDSTLTTPTAAITPTGNNQMDAELKKYVGGGFARSQAGAHGVAGTNAYGSSATEGGQALSTATSALGAIEARSKASAGALPAEQHPSDVRKANAASDLAATLDLIQKDSGANTKRVTDTTAAQDAARKDTTAKLATAIQNLYSGKIGAQQDFLTAFLNASQAYESANSSLTNQKVSMTQTSKPLISTLGDQAMSAAITAAAGHI